MQQPGRHWEASADTMYRYGYNGIETDPEVKEGWGQHYTTYFRQYDPRLGRWWSNDTVVQAGESPYAAMSNNPIVFTDPFGNCLDCPKDAKQGDVHKGWIYTGGKWVPKPSSGTTSSESVYEQAMAARNTAKPISNQTRRALASPAPKLTEAERFRLEQTDNNDVKVVRHYANPGRTGMHVTQFGNGDEIVEHGRAPTIGPTPPPPKDPAAYFSQKLEQVVANPKSSPMVKLLAGAVNQTLSTPSIVLTGETAAGTPVSSFERAVSFVSVLAPAAKLLSGAELLAMEGNVAGRSLFASGVKSGVGDLTVQEVAQIQAVVNKAERPLTVIGSAAKGSRRGVGTNLPIGKGPGTRSDIDYLVGHSSGWYYNGLESRLPSLDPEGIILGIHNPFIGPGISFSPGVNPIFIPGR